MTRILDLKSTLNLPKTAFSMKASLPVSEPRQLAEWEEQGLYRRILEARKDAPLYVMHDGPPYPTGEIHIGTAENKILKDLVVKSRTMLGLRAPYVPGWDCHGLPIETKVEKELPGGKGSVPPAEFRRRCREFAGRYVDIHRREFKRLGIFGQWDDPYLTMSNHYEATIADAFVTFLEKGYVHKGLKPVYWCVHDSTALAEAEVEYKEVSSPSIWIRFPVTADPASDRLGEGVAAAAWTTTPWSLPGTLALAFHPHYEYVVAETSAGKLLLAAGRLEAVLQDLGLQAERTHGPWKGKELEGIRFQHPFLDWKIPAVLADHVALDRGTGVVTTAPGHGAEDFHTGQRYGLPAHAPVDDQGRFTEGPGDYKGKAVFEANPPIIGLLQRNGALLGQAKLTHSYPHCWRCLRPVIFRATEQWFIELDRAGADGPVRQRALEAITRVRWTPEWGQERLREMVSGRPDWCISRQRMWGVPIVVLHCARCKARLEDIAALRHVTRTWFAKEGADAWFSRPATELLPPGTKCKCGAADWVKENDILDVWFDSGSSHLAVLQDAGLKWPADMYLEGPDQFRGWFQSSLLVAIGAKGGAPYEHIFVHGWALDDKNEPMSKSRGNAIYPKEICEKYGADILRLWVASQDYHADVSMGERVLAQLSESYRKIRNTFRWVLGNLDEFDPERHAVADSELLELDRWMLHRAAELAARCREHYEKFEFYRVFHAVHDFCVVDLSAFYFDVLKDRLYTFAKYNAKRRSGQTAVWRIGHALVRLLAPILVFTAEEIWKHLPGRKGDPESVHMAVFPAAAEVGAPLDDRSLQDWERLLFLRQAALKELEENRAARVISGSLEARVLVRSNSDELSGVLRRHAADLPALFIVSKVELQSDGGKSCGTGDISVSRAEGAKCERCWNYSVQVGKNADYPTCCERCVAALNEIATYPEHATA